MNSIKLIGWAALLSLGLVGCSGTKTLYHWGDYNETAYEYQKEPSPETQQAHVDEMLEIVEDATDDHELVPPGIYFELGMYYAEQNQIQTAKVYFDKELQTFPESKTMVAFALQQLGEPVQ
jgi:hypothetical protein